MSINKKLFIMLILVVLYAILNISEVVIDGIEKRQELSKVEVLNELSKKLSLFIHETQKERGASAGYLGSKGKKFTTILPAQRILTDEKLRELNTYVQTVHLEDYSSALKSELLEVEKQSSKINSIRARVDQQNISVGESVKFYTGMNRHILNVTALTSKVSSNPELIKALSAYSNFLKSKERAGIERAVMSATFANDAFKPGMFAKWIRLMAEQNSYADAFLASADEKTAGAFKNAMQNQSVKDVQRLRDIALSKAQTGAFNVEAENWFATITKKINVLKKVDDSISESNTEAINRLYAKTSTYMITVLLKNILFGLILIGVVLFIQRGIISGVRSKLENIQHISDNKDLSIVLPVVAKSEDELNHVSIALNDLLGSFRSTIENAVDISKVTQDQSGQLDKVVVHLGENISLEKEKVGDMKSLIDDVGVHLDNVEEASISTTEDLEKTVEVLSTFVSSLETVVENVENGATRQEELSQKVNALTEQAKNIKDVLSIISDIADQTNLLALNAAIEAARAGEHGRGFAVVADEVRKLAERTQKSLSEISMNVNMITQNVNDIYEQTDKTTQEMQETSASASDLIDQAELTKEKLFGTSEKSTDVMKRTIYIATKTKGLISLMFEVVEASEKTNELSIKVEQVSHTLFTGTQELEKTLEQFKV